MVLPSRPLVPQRLVVADCRVLDPRDGALGPPADLEIQDRRIAAVAPAGAIPRAGATVIDAGGAIMHRAEPAPRGGG